MKIFGRAGMPLMQSQRYSFSIVGSNPYSKDAEVSSLPTRTPSSRNILSLTTPSMLSLSGLEEPGSELLLDLSSKDLRQRVFQNCSPRDLTQWQLKEVSMLLLATCTQMTGDGTLTTLWREAIGWEIKMRSTTCVNRLLRQSCNCNLTVSPSPEQRKEKYTRGPLEANQNSMAKVIFF